MAYDFQGRVLRAGDMLDNREIGIDITRAAEQASSLDATNLADGVFATADVDEECFHAIYVSRTEVDPVLGTPGSFTDPDFSATDVLIVQPAAIWDSAESVTFTCGEAELDIAAFAQWFTDLATTPVTNPKPSGLQYGIRVDGQVVYFTGSADLTTVPFIPVRAVIQRDATHMGPGPQTPEDTYHSAGLGPYNDFVRLSAYYAVGPGSHTVDLVQRIIPQQVGAVDERPQIATFNRSLRVIVRELYPAVASTATDTSVAFIPTETTFSATELRTDRLDEIAADLNAVVPGMIQRGAVQYRHIPDVLLDGATTNIGGTPSGITSLFPGFTSTTIDTTGSGTGWFLLADDTGPPGVPLSVGTTGSHGAFAIADVPCFIDIFASVAIVDISNGGSSLLQTLSAVFMVAYKFTDDATVYMVPCSQGLISTYAHGNSTLANGATAIKTRVSLQCYLDFRDTPSTANIDWISVYVSRLNIGATASRPTVFWRRCNLNVWVYRK